MIFNKKDTGTTELFNATGSYWQSNDFSVIRSEVESSCSTVRGLIGKQLFDRAEAHYLGAEFDPEAGDTDTILVKRLQTAAGMLAMYRYYQSILSHEDGGRRFKVNDESEKTPFAWQFERDDQALIDKYYRALDELYILLEESNIPEWEQSRVFQDRAMCLVRDLDTFQRAYPIEDSHRMFFLLVPFMLEAQDRHIVPIIGADNFARMVTGEELDDNLRQQAAVAKLCIPLYAVITAVRRMSIKILPTMIVRRFTDSFQGKRGGNLDREAEHHWLRMLEQEADDAKTELQRIVSGCRNPFTEADLVPKNDPHKKFCTT